MKNEEGVHDSFEERIKRLEDAGNYHGLSLAYYERAVMLYDKKKSFLGDLARSREWELKYWQQSGMKFVKILSKTGCPKCRKLHGRMVTIEQALIAMPLPNKECTFEMKEGSKRFFCRCKYVGTEPE